MNNKQFILIVVLLSLISGVIGYNISGFQMAVFGMISVPALFLYIGD